jgi:ATP-dependent RNA helicase DDX54/DBP10
MDLTNDENAKSFGEPTRSKMRWDKKSKKYVSRENDDDGSKGAKMIRGESGVKIAASFQSGRFDKWKRANRLGKLPHVGEAERPGGANHVAHIPSGVRYKHKQERAPKEADKYRDDFQVRKKRVDEAREKRVGRFRDGMGSKKELKGRDDIRKARQEKEKKRLKNARPTRKK